MNEAVDALSPELNITLYRLVQECLTNAVRHSRARSVAVRLAAEPLPCGELPARVWLRVQESGLEAHATTPGANGMGLLGMRERVEAHGGELKISTQPGEGLALEAWLPIRAPCTEAADA